MEGEVWSYPYLIPIVAPFAPNFVNPSQTRGAHLYPLKRNSVIEELAQALTQIIAAENEPAFLARIAMTCLRFIRTTIFLPCSNLKGSIELR